MALLRFGKKTEKHNPGGREILYEPDRCVLCRKCVTGCPAKAVRLDALTKAWSQDVKACIGCGSCVKKCPENALRFA